MKGAAVFTRWDPSLRWDDEPGPSAVDNFGVLIQLRGMKPMRATAAQLDATISAAASSYYYYGFARAGPE
ncbi:MAG TPA: hypothetical protein VE053_03155 [Allosphingosinicella sp.]|nr:hypothetical protein [Allosphingosinicella sp.]